MSGLIAIILCRIWEILGKRVVKLPLHPSVFIGTYSLLFRYNRLVIGVYRPIGVFNPSILSGHETEEHNLPDQVLEADDVDTLGLYCCST